MSDATLNAPSGSVAQTAVVDPALQALLAAGQARRARLRAAAPAAVSEPIAISPPQAPAPIEAVAPAAAPVEQAAPSGESVSQASARPPASLAASQPFLSLGASVARAPAAPIFTAPARAEPVRLEPSFGAPSANANPAQPARSTTAAQRLEQAQRQAQSPEAKTAFVGSRPPAQRSIWRHLRWAAGASAFVATLVVCAAALTHQSPASKLGASAQAPQGASAPAWQHVGDPQPLAAAPSASPQQAQQASSASHVGRLAPMGYGSAVISQPKAPDLLKLPIIIDDSNPLTEHELAVALLPHDPFLALAVTVERLRTRSYYDVAGANIGMGYCLPMRLAEYGKERVTRDFEQAGMSAEQIKNMLSGNRKKVLSVEITQSEALRLLMITKADYAQLARNAVGSKMFDAMPAHRQTALTYLAYNSNIGQFGQLVADISRGHDLQAMNEMVPSFRMAADAPLQKNYRLGSYLWAAWSGTLSDAIADPMHHEGLYANENGLSSFQRAYGLTQKHGAHAKPKFATPAPVPSSQPAVSAASASPPAAPSAAASAPAPSTQPSAAQAKAAAPAAASTPHSASAQQHAKIVAPAALSADQARALRVRLANRRQAASAAQAQSARPSAQSSANAQESARARLLEQAEASLDSAPSRGPSF